MRRGRHDDGRDVLCSDELVGLRQIDPDRFVWVVVGDLSRVRNEIEGLGMGEAVQIDPAGNVVD